VKTLQDELTSVREQARADAQLNASIDTHGYAALKAKVATLSAEVYKFETQRQVDSIQSATATQYVTFVSNLAFAYFGFNARNPKIERMILYLLA
jgi:hypothetical protein